ncbi:MAG: hypothetical protein GC162_07035 [Planctomycetes bacterium]|nr:hypothetical protein [Planctomycetota bacterium]
MNTTKMMMGALMVMAVMAVSAKATVTFSPFAGTNTPLADQNGVTITDGTYVMVLDLDNDGWNGRAYTDQAVAPEDNATSFVWDADDLILDLGQITDGFAFPFSSLDPAGVSGYTAGVDHYFLLAFAKAFNPADSGPGAGVFYSATDLGTAGNDGDTLTPFADPGNANLVTVGPTTGGGDVPEPTSAFVALISGGLLVSRRRNRA